jgi:CheY-like chemotaxis protein
MVSRVTNTSQPAPARVLIVDDNVDIAKMMSVLVAHCGHLPRVVHDPQTSLDVAREFQPDVAFLDIGLPGMSGHELARRLRQEPGLQNVLLVALTGYSQEEDRQRSEESGFDVHLVKPVTLAMLQQILAQRRH